MDLFVADVANLPLPNHVILTLPLLFPRPAGEPYSLWSRRAAAWRTAAAECRPGWSADLIIFNTSVGDVTYATGALMNYYSVIEVPYCTVRRPDTSHQLATWRPRPWLHPCWPRLILAVRYVTAMPHLNTANQQQNYRLKSLITTFHAIICLASKTVANVLDIGKNSLQRTSWSERYGPTKPTNDRYVFIRQLTWGRYREHVWTVYDKVKHRRSTDDSYRRTRLHAAKSALQCNDRIVHRTWRPHKQQRQPASQPDRQTP